MCAVTFYEKKWAHKAILKGNANLATKIKILNQCVVPSLTYGAQTWSLTSSQANRLRTIYFKMQRSISKIKLWDRVKLSEIKEETKALNLEVAARSLKIHYAGHVVRENGKWIRLMEEWTPLDHKCKKGRPPYQMVGQTSQRVWIAMGKSSPRSSEMEADGGSLCPETSGRDRTVTSCSTLS